MLSPLPLSTLLYQFRKFTPSFLRSAARVVNGYAWGPPLLARAILLKQRSKTRVFETPASASPDLFYEPVHSARVNQPAAAARRPR